MQLGRVANNNRTYDTEQQQCGILPCGKMRVPANCAHATPAKRMWGKCGRVEMTRMRDSCSQLQLPAWFSSHNTLAGYTLFSGAASFTPKCPEASERCRERALLHVHGPRILDLQCRYLDCHFGFSFWSAPSRWGTQASLWPESPWP